MFPFFRGVVRFIGGFSVNPDSFNQFECENIRRKIYNSYSWPYSHVKKKKSSSHKQSVIICVCVSEQINVFSFFPFHSWENIDAISSLVFIQPVWGNTACFYPFPEGFTASCAILLWYVISHTLYRPPIMTRHQKQPLSFPTLSAGPSCPSVRPPVFVSCCPSLSLTLALFL